MDSQRGLDFHLTQIEFSDGRSISLRHDSILVLTGANNVGKSSTLTEIFDHVVDGHALGPLLRSVSVRAKGPTNAFVEYVNLKSLPADMGYVNLDGRPYRISDFEDDIKRSFVGSRAAISFFNHLTAIKR
ncbi:hypothetical protein IVB33_29125, partial [Bradyrhizobium sp. 24]|nr:hypothetical protein [Bradyrhizobium sp. 24]